MPCSGPNIPAVEKQADQVSEAMLYWLQSRFAVREPDWPQHMREEYAKNVDRFQEAVRELLVIEACASW
jgi:hypothetical protein